MAWLNKTTGSITNLQDMNTQREIHLHCIGVGSKGFLASGIKDSKCAVLALIGYSGGMH